MYEPLEKEFTTILKVNDKSVAIDLIKEHKDFIVNNGNLRNFLRTAIFSDNKILLQALTETKIFESLKIPYSTRVELLNTLANSYSYAYGSNLKLSQDQAETLRSFKNSDTNTINDDFSRYKSLLKGLAKSQPELIQLLKPYYHPENFPSEVAQLAKINTVTDNKSEVKAAINKAAENFKSNIKLMDMLEKANHIVDVDSTINFDFNIYYEPEKGKINEPRFTAERSAIQEFIDDYPNKSSNEYNLIKNAAGAANMLFNYVRSINDLQKFQEENKYVEPEKLSPDKLEQLVKILNKIENSQREMFENQKMLKQLMLPQTRQEKINTQETSVPLAISSAPEKWAPSKPILRMAREASQDAIDKLQKAVTDNDQSAFNQVINNLVSKGSKDQLAVTLSSLIQLDASLKKSPVTKADTGLVDKLKMVKEGIKSLSKASERPHIGTDEVRSAPPMTRKM